MRKVALAASLLCALAANAAPGSAAPADMILLGSTEAAAGADDAPPQWRRALREIAREEPAVAACERARARCPNAGTADWLDLLDGLAEAPPAAQLRQVHRFINRWPYRSDLANFGRSDLWAGPVEFLARSGDCEDYAIAKYVSLRRLGFAADRLRLVVLEDTARGLAHAVLAVELGGEVLILDNLADEPVPQVQLAHYVPYYSLNETGRWVHAPLSGSAIATAAR